MPVLSSTEITQALPAVPDWKLKNGSIARQFSFTDFSEAMSFVNEVAALAERAGHHPDIDIRYNKVELALASHDAGGITNADFEMAAKIDELL